jgi:hypothetical protein
VAAFDTEHQAIKDNGIIGGVFGSKKGAEECAEALNADGFILPYTYEVQRWLV